MDDHRHGAPNSPFLPSRAVTVFKSFVGETLPPVKADAKGLTLTVTGAPQYLAPQGRRRK